MRSILVPLALALSLASAPVLADCKDDLPKLKTRINHEQDKDKQGKAVLHWNRAIKIQEAGGADTDCRNEVARIWQALNAEPLKKKVPTPADEVAPKPPLPPFIPYGFVSKPAGG